MTTANPTQYVKFYDIYDSDDIKSTTRKINNQLKKGWVIKSQTLLTNDSTLFVVFEKNNI